MTLKTTTKWGAVESVATDLPNSLRDIRTRYEKGAPLSYLKRRYHLSASEMEDIAPEEREINLPQGPGGY